MKVLYPIKSSIMFFAVILALVVSLFNLRSMWEQTEVRNGYLSCDEGFTYSAARSISEGGYFGFRCRDVIIGSCYGGLQSMIDAAMIRAIPKNLSQRGDLSFDSGQRWPWLAENQTELYVLRISRFLFVLALFLVLPRLFSENRTIGLFLTLLITSSWSFANAWSGMKNDYPSLLFFGLYLLFLRRSFQGLNERKYDWNLYLWPFFIGTLGIWIRPVLLVPVFLGTASYLISYLWSSRKYFDFVLRAVSGLVLFFIVYVVLHPNIFASSLEAKWLEPIIFTGNPSFTREHFLLELKMFLFGSWPFFFYLAGRMRFSRHWKLSKIFSFEVFLIILFFAMSFFTFKGFQGKPYYYLPVFFVSLVLFSYVLPKKKILFISFTIFSIFVNGYVFYVYQPHLRPFPYATGISDGLTLELELEKRIKNELTMGTEVWVDRNLRPNIPYSGSSKELKYFDSFVWSPSELAANLNEDALVIFTCWQKAELKEEAPTISQWSLLSQKFCGDLELVSNRHYFPFTQFYKSSKFFVINGLELKKQFPSLELSLLEKNKIHPRTFHGAENGRDFLEEYFLWDPRLDLKKSIILKDSFESLSLDFASDCKQDQELLLEVRTGKKVLRSAANLNVVSKVCADYPKLCNNSAFLKWSNRKYSDRLTITKASFPSGEPIELTIRSTGSCKIYLRPLQFEKE